MSSFQHSGSYVIFVQSNQSLFTSYVAYHSKILESTTMTIKLSFIVVLLKLCFSSSFSFSNKIFSLVKEDVSFNSNWASGLNFVMLIR